MKKIKSFSLIIVIFSIFACSNEAVDPALIAQINAANAANGGGTTGTGGTGGEVVSNGNFTAKIDGQNFSADATAGNFITTNGVNVLTVTGSKPTGEYIGIQLINPSTGTFIVNAIGGNQILSYKQDTSTTDIFSAFDSTTSQPTGTLTISSLDLINNKISGTFSFVGHLQTSSTQTKQITNGVFTSISFVNTTIPAVTSPLVGTYLQTAFNTSTATDLNGDGIASNNQMTETACFNNNYLILNADNTFSATSKGIDIDATVTPSVISCFSDPSFSGTWTATSTTLTTSYVDAGVIYTDNFNIAGSTLVNSQGSGQIVGTSGGNPVYLTSNISIVFTKQ